VSGTRDLPNGPHAAVVVEHSDSASRKRRSDSRADAEGSDVVGADGNLRFAHELAVQAMDANRPVVAAGHERTVSDEGDVLRCSPGGDDLERASAVEVVDGNAGRVTGRDPDVLAIRCGDDVVREASDGRGGLDPQKLAVILETLPRDMKLLLSQQMR